MVRRSIQVLVLGLAVLAPVLAVRPSPAAAEMQRPEDVVAVMAPELDAMYARWLGADYRSPADLYWYNTADAPGAVQTRCGWLSTHNAYYCGRDKSIYLDYTYMWELMEIGDYAVAFVLAHEWAHHVQYRLGVLGKVYSIQQELQADCLTGVASRYVEGVGMLEATDLAEGYLLAWNLGDEPGVDPTHEQAHGSAGDRQAWFLQGYWQYGWDACETY